MLAICDEVLYRYKMRISVTEIDGVKDNPEVERISDTIKNELPKGGVLRKIAEAGETCNGLCGIVL